MLWLGVGSWSLGRNGQLFQKTSMFTPAKATFQRDLVEVTCVLMHAEFPLALHPS